MNNLTIKLEPSQKEPLYQQLYRALIVEILEGRLQEHEKLPSKRSLCTHLGISQNTVETAYALLVAEGYVQAKPRSGYYVCQIEQLPPVEEQPYDMVPQAAQSYRYAFSTNAVDTSVFPYASWARIMKETVYQNPALLNAGDKQGDLVLREALCKFLHEYRGVKCSPMQIVVGAGMEYLLDLLIQLFDKNKRFALENPGYRATYRTIQNNGQKIVPIALDQEGMRMDLLTAAETDIAYVTPSHQFPTGVMMPISRRMQLLKWANTQRGRYIIEDDYDSEFRYDTHPIPAMQGLDKNEKVIYMGTFSRSIAPSIRVAYMVLPPHLLENYLHRFAFSSSTVSRFEQQTLARFLDNGLYARHLRRMGNLYKKRRNVLYTQLQTIPGATIAGAQAGLHMVLMLPGRTETELVQAACAQRIKVHGLSEYYVGRQPESGTLVLGYAGLQEHELVEAVGLLKAAWT